VVGIEASVRQTRPTLRAARIGADKRTIHRSPKRPDCDVGCDPTRRPVEVFPIMRALDPEVFDAVWTAIEQSVRSGCIGSNQSRSCCTSSAKRARITRRPATWSPRRSLGRSRCERRPSQAKVQSIDRAERNSSDRTTFVQSLARIAEGRGRLARADRTRWCPDSRASVASIVVDQLRK
jgi:hypothetical protein